MARLIKAQWKALIAEQDAPGQTAVAFCAERGIGSYDFYTGKKCERQFNHT